MRRLSSALILFALAGGPSASAQPSTAALTTSSWRLSQNPARPWQGTPRADISDHRNGASEDGRALFSDPRWAARAIAIELRD